ncbi:alkaline phosphatase [Svornostia abyssi]|uniref:Alkaline phosphatase n=1 Tax=Svornostia abyssi TaxID=2898438 RepID=A0ABY5PNF3_9ACTN|nr:alkaline phosphatase [Parviterribacteraceae bacterium J379]
MLPKRTLAALTATVAAGAVTVGVVVASDPVPPDNGAAIKAAIDSSTPKNVILIIGDGMGDSELTIGRYYQNGAKGAPLATEKLPFTGSLLTWNLEYGAGPDYDPGYVPDSAPTATAWSTGKKTGDARLSQGMSTGETVPGSNAGFETTFEIMKSRGKAIGNVATSEITDATPAAPSSHISRRACHGPADTRSLCPAEAKTAIPAGLGSIAEQQVDHLLDVNLGGGKNRYAQDLDGNVGTPETVIDYAVSNGYKVVEDKAALAAYNGPKKVLGLFNGGNMRTKYNPLVAAPTPGAGSETTKCTLQDRGNEPSLLEMTRAAVRKLRNDSDGFFLQVESASIDKRDHASDLCGQIGETEQLDETVAYAMEFQKRNPDTLVIVTADHSHTSQIVSPTQDPPGFYATVETADGAPMRVSYGTGKSAGGQSHTGARVPVAAVGPQASNVMGARDQTDLFHTLIGRP